MLTYSPQKTPAKSMVEVVDSAIVQKALGGREAVFRPGIIVVSRQRRRNKQPAVLRNVSPVAQSGAGAKKCWGPAPLEIINILNIRNLSFSGGAGHH